MKKTFLCLIFFVLVMTLAACTTANPGALTPTPSVTPFMSPLPGATGLDGLPTVPPTNLNPNATEPPAAPTLSNQESAALAKQCETRIARISEVDASTCVVLGDRMLVGVSFTPQYKGALTDRIRQMVEKNVHDVTPSISTTLVTVDKDLVSKIAALKEQQQNGSTAKDLEAEFNAIAQSVNAL